MKKMISILIMSHLLIAACVTTNQNLKSLTSSYDGVWEGYTDTPEGRFEIKMEIKNGIMSGYCEETKIKGYIESNGNFFISPFSIMGAQVILDTNQMSPDRIEGTVVAPGSKPSWFVVKRGDVK